MSMDNMAMKRKEEADTSNTGTPIRSERLFSQSNYWYFRTREGMDIGPFDTAQEANEGINGFMDFLNNAEPEVIERISEHSSNAA